MKDRSKIIKYPLDPKKKDNLNLQYKKSLYICVKIALEKLQTSNNLYANAATHFIERCVYLRDEFIIKYFLKHSTTVRQDVETISEESLVHLEPIFVLKSVVDLVSSFSLVNYRTHEYSAVMNEVVVHRLVKETLRAIQRDEEREYNILEELVSKDHPELKDVEGDILDVYFIPRQISIVWSYAANYECLIRKYFLEKGSLKVMIDNRFFNETKQIVKQLGDTNSARKILAIEVHENGFESALRKDFCGLRRYFIQQLKINRGDIPDSLWKAGITDTVKCCMLRMNLDILTELVEGLDLQGDFLSSADSDNLLVNAIYWGKLEAAKYFLDKNANPCEKGRDGYTALHACAFRWNGKRAEAANLLTARIVSKYPELVYAKDSVGRPPFMIAAERGNKCALNFILRNMLDSSSQINLPDNEGNTSLMLAIKNVTNTPMSDVIMVLMGHGADIHYRNPLNLWNAWHYACFAGLYHESIPSLHFFEILEILVANMVSLDEQNKDGDTFLHMLIKDNDTFPYIEKSDLSKFLDLIAANKMGSLFDCRNGDGLTILELVNIPVSNSSVRSSVVFGEMKKGPNIARRWAESDTAITRSDHAMIKQSNHEVVIEFIQKFSSK
ncbi:uncharacterized protein LOC118438827 isoform X1 [Folsomia candida]|uniref:uncharacterized protein LOC118438827 isoform X1 n=1 Tax=Folsomia candida TaxID=158441 RepID=UPI001604EA99|nr:uncharacterized protein LOC118438827 isoform X1 [Folsomia candida]